MESSTSPQADNGALVFGMILLVLGTAFTLDKLEILEVGAYWRYWPTLVIGYGICLLEEPGRQRLGLWVLVYGAWQLVVSLELMSLRQALAPLLIAAGCILIAEALANGPRGTAVREDHHGR